MFVSENMKEGKHLHYTVMYPDVCGFKLKVNMFRRKIKWPVYIKLKRYIELVGAKKVH